MNKYQFLHDLDELLSCLPYDKKHKIMYKYEQLFNEGYDNNRSDQEIIEEIGEPKQIASHYLSDNFIENTNDHFTDKKSTKKYYYYKPRHTTNIILLLILIFINLLLVGPYLGLWGVFISFVAIGFSLLIAGVLLFISGIVHNPLNIISIPVELYQHPVLIISSSIILICIGIILLILMFYIIKFVSIGTYKYLNSNVKLIREG
jgi:uncharacterized membrane protein